MFNLNEKWPDSLIETLKTRGPSMMAKAFMAEFGKTKDSVYNHAKKYKVKFLPDVFWTPAEIEVIRQAGSETEAAKALGIGRDAVLRQSKRSGIVLKETRPPKAAGQAPKRVRTAQKSVPPASRRFVHEERSRIEYCPSCHSPVSDWAGHTARIGCRRQAA
jgi:ribosomal protein L27